MTAPWQIVRVDDEPAPSVKKRRCAPAWATPPLLREDKPSWATPRPLDEDSGASGSQVSRASHRASRASQTLQPCWTQPRPFGEEEGQCLAISSDSCSKKPRRAVECTVTALRSAGAAQSGNSTAYAKNGTSSARIRKVLQGCCRCRGRCHTKFKEAELEEVCQLFWALSSEEQSFLALG